VSTPRPGSQLARACANSGMLTVAVPSFPTTMLAAKLAKAWRPAGVRRPPAPLPGGDHVYRRRSHRRSHGRAPEVQFRFTVLQQGHAMFTAGDEQGFQFMARNSARPRSTSVASSDMVLLPP